MPGLMLLPPGPGRCTACAAFHKADQAHSVESLYYLFRFNAAHGRSPTWADAVAHLPAALQSLWRQELEKLGQPFGDPATAIAEPYSLAK